MIMGTSVIGDMLREAQRLSDKTGADVYKETGVNPGYYSRMLSGKQIPSAGSLLRLAKPLGLDIRELSYARMLDELRKYVSAHHMEKLKQKGIVEDARSDEELRAALSRYIKYMSRGNLELMCHMVEGFFPDTAGPEVERFFPATPDPETSED